jgi:hypothetical protein
LNSGHADFQNLPKGPASKGFKTLEFLRDSIADVLSLSPEVPLKLKAPYRFQVRLHQTDTLTTLMFFLRLWESGTPGGPFDALDRVSQAGR